MLEFLWREIVKSRVQGGRIDLIEQLLESSAIHLCFILPPIVFCAEGRSGEESGEEEEEGTTTRNHVEDVSIMWMMCWLWL